MTNAELFRLEGGWARVRRELWRELKSPSFWLPFAILALLGGWMMPASYFCLWTLTWAPSGFPLIASIVVLLSTSVYRLASMLYRLVKFLKPVTVARKRMRARQSGALEELIVAREAYRKRVKPHIGWAALAGYATIPMFVALSVFGEMQPISYRKNGRLLVESQQAQLNWLLKELQRTGVFRWRSF